MKVRIYNRSSKRLHQELFQDLKSQKKEWYKNANKDALIRVSIKRPVQAERDISHKG